MDDDWIPASCTLPTVEQPSRRNEFDEFLAEDVVMSFAYSLGRAAVSP